MKLEYLELSMQNTALSFTERSGHCGATSSDHWSWHPLATSEVDKVISYTAWRKQESWSKSTSVDVTLLMSFRWCHSFYVQCEYHFVDVTQYKLRISHCWYHFVDVSLLMSRWWCQSVDVILLTIRYVNEQQL